VGDVDGGGFGRGTECVEFHSEIGAKGVEVLRFADWMPGRPQGAEFADEVVEVFIGRSRKKPGDVDRDYVVHLSGRTVRR
jgi:hypothetical protein